MATRDLSPLRQLFTAPVLTAALAVLLIVSLYLVSGITDNAARFSELHGVLLVVNLLVLLLLGVLIVRGLLRLVSQVRQDAPGSRLTLRLVVLLALLAVVPVSVVYYFSLGFLDRSIDSWFDVEVERALDHSLELSRAAITARTTRHLNQTRDMAEALVSRQHSDVGQALDRLRQEEQASEVALFQGDGRIVAFGSAAHEGLLPSSLPRTAAIQARSGIPSIALEPSDPEGLHVRVIIALPGASDNLLQAIFPVSSELARLADEVQEGHRQYQAITYLRRPLQTSFIATLSVVLMLAILGGIWVAILLANRLVAPIRDLAAGTRAVAAGDYSKRLPLPRAGDELGFLVRSFNDMTARVGRARDAARRSQHQAEVERAFLETVLACLSSGVLTLDAEGRILGTNQSAGTILDTPLERAEGRRLRDLADNAPHLEPLVEPVERHIARPGADWSESATLFTAQGRRLLAVHGSRLPVGEHGRAGHVVVFDDVTTLVQAQKEAAWGEVARRLAHEIKNPLTPIRLASERLRHKLMGDLGPEQGELLDRSTRTIIGQVEGLESMVRAFADYARTPPLEHQPIDLNELIQEVIELYRDGTAQVLLSLDPVRPRLQGDPDRLRRVLNNLLHNALNAVNQGDENRRISVSTRCLPGPEECSQVEIRVQDSGPGIPAELRSQVFEPYVTTRERGTGLGLAIARKAVEEHGGRIHMEESTLGGACAVIVLPASGNPNPGGAEQ